MAGKATGVVSGLILAALALSARAQTGASSIVVDTLTASVVEEPQQRAAVANISDYIFNFLTAPAVAENNAGGLVAMDVAANPLLATLPGSGASLFRGFLEPCGILAPHIHPRGTEIYFAISQNVSISLLGENGETIKLAAATGLNNAFIAPQGLIHSIQNLGCEVASFTQSFDSVDPGLITVASALAGFSPEILATSGLGATPPADSPFTIDQDCAKACSILPPGPTTQPSSFVAAPALGR